MEDFLDRVRQRVAGKQISEMYSLELFCGTGGLTAELRKLGLNDSIGVDNHVHSRLKCPVLRLDLSKKSSLELIDRMLEQERLTYVHMGPPCGTSSRARWIQRPGRFNPKPARSDKHPNGLPGLAGLLKLRVDLANKLYNACSYIFKRCWDIGILATVENPGRSYMWDTSFWQEFLRFECFYTFFHHCCYGSKRRKLTKLAHTIPALCDMCALCPGETPTHQHLPWGVQNNKWATAEETAYPTPLCKTWASLILEFLVSLGAVPPARDLSDRHILDHKAAQTALAHQSASKRIPPLVKEFKQIHYIMGRLHDEFPTKCSSDVPIPPDIQHDFPSPIIPAGARLLRTQVLGDSSASAQSLASDDNKHVVDRKTAIKFVYGIPWTAQEFIHQACNASHPKDIITSLDPCLRQVIENNAQDSFSVVAGDRIKAMTKWVGRARELEEQERALKESLPSHCAKILQNKRLSLFREMLEEAKFPDKEIANEMCAGFKLSGEIPKSPLFRKKRVSATMTVDDLKQSASVTRQGILLATQSSGDPALDRALQEATDHEISRGWLKGPIPQDQIPENSCVSRRFGIWQGGKCRPIDNLKESGLNATTFSGDTITVHTADVIGAGVAYKMACEKIDNNCRALRARSWDLRKAYKNLPVHVESLDDNLLSVFNPDKCAAMIYQQFVLPFGSRSSVHAFVRVAIAIWFLGIHYFRLHWSVYFDDFVAVEYDNLSRLTEMCIDNFLRLLGWETSSDKDTEFGSVAKFLGLEINLTESHLGVFSLENTEKRKTELVQNIEGILTAGRLTTKDGLSLRGRLLFAENQISGRLAGRAMSEISKHLASGCVDLENTTIEALKFLQTRLSTGRPRTISSTLTETIHIFVDASYEPASPYPGGLGGVLIFGNGSLRHFSEVVGSEALKNFTAESKHPIFELECLAMYIGIRLWQSHFRGRHLVIFTDNDGALGAMIKGYSKNDIGARIVHNTNELLDLSNTICWFERVNTASNIADEPSRCSTCQNLGPRDQIQVLEYIRDAIK